MFAGTELDVLQYGFVLLARRLCSVLRCIDSRRYCTACIQWQADLHTGLHKIIVVEDLLRSRAAAEIEAGRLIELGEGARNIQSRPPFRLRAFEVQPRGFAARRGCGELVVGSDRVGPGLSQVFGASRHGQKKQRGKSQVLCRWFHRRSLGIRSDWTSTVVLIRIF